MSMWKHGPGSVLDGELLEVCRGDGPGASLGCGWVEKKAVRRHVHDTARLLKDALNDLRKRVDESVWESGRFEMPTPAEISTVTWYWLHSCYDRMANPMNGQRWRTGYDTHAFTVPPASMMSELHQMDVRRSAPPPEDKNPPSKFSGKPPPHPSGETLTVTRAESLPDTPLPGEDEKWCPPVTATFDGPRSRYRRRYAAFHALAPRWDLPATDRHVTDTHFRSNDDRDLLGEEYLCISERDPDSLTDRDVRRRAQELYVLFPRNLPGSCHYALAPRIPLDGTGNNPTLIAEHIITGETYHKLHHAIKRAYVGLNMATKQFWTGVGGERPVLQCEACRHLFVATVGGANYEEERVISEVENLATGDEDEEDEAEQSEGSPPPSGPPPDDDGGGDDEDASMAEGEGDDAPAPSEGDRADGRTDDSDMPSAEQSAPDQTSYDSDPHSSVADATEPTTHVSVKEYSLTEMELTTKYYTTLSREQLVMATYTTPVDVEVKLGLRPATLVTTSAHPGRTYDTFEVLTRGAGWEDGYDSHRPREESMWLLLTTAYRLAAQRWDGVPKPLVTDGCVSALRVVGRRPSNTIRSQWLHSVCSPMVGSLTDVPRLIRVDGGGQDEGSSAEGSGAVPSSSNLAWTSPTKETELPSGVAALTKQIQGLTDHLADVMDVLRAHRETDLARVEANRKEAAEQARLAAERQDKLTETLQNSIMVSSIKIDDQGATIKALAEELGDVTKRVSTVNKVLDIQLRTFARKVEARLPTGTPLVDQTDAHQGGRDPEAQAKPPSPDERPTAEKASPVEDATTPSTREGGGQKNPDAAQKYTASGFADGYDAFGRVTPSQAPLTESTSADHKTPPPPPSRSSESKGECLANEGRYQLGPITHVSPSWRGQVSREENRQFDQLAKHQQAEQREHAEKDRHSGGDALAHASLTSQGAWDALAAHAIGVKGADRGATDSASVSFRSPLERKGVPSGSAAPGSAATPGGARPPSGRGSELRPPSSKGSGPRLRHDDELDDGTVRYATFATMVPRSRQEGRVYLPLDRSTYAPLSGEIYPMSMITQMGSVPAADLDELLTLMETVGVAPSVDDFQRPVEGTTPAGEDVEWRGLVRFEMRAAPLESQQMVLQSIETSMASGEGAAELPCAREIDYSRLASIVSRSAYDEADDAVIANSFDKLLKQQPRPRDPRESRGAAHDSEGGDETSTPGKPYHRVSWGKAADRDIAASMPEWKEDEAIASYHLRVLRSIDMSTSNSRIYMLLKEEHPVDTLYSALLIRLDENDRFRDRVTSDQAVPQMRLILSQVKQRFPEVVQTTRPRPEDAERAMEMIHYLLAGIRAVVSLRTLAGLIGAEARLLLSRIRRRTRDAADSDHFNYAVRLYSQFCRLWGEALSDEARPVLSPFVCEVVNQLGQSTRAMAMQGANLFINGLLAAGDMHDATPSARLTAESIRRHMVDPQLINVSPGESMVSAARVDSGHRLSTPDDLLILSRVEHRSLPRDLLTFMERYLCTNCAFGRQLSDEATVVRVNLAMNDDYTADVAPNLAADDCDDEETLEADIRNVQRSRGRVGQGNAPGGTNGRPKGRAPAASATTTASATATDAATTSTIDALLEMRRELTDTLAKQAEENKQVRERMQAENAQQCGTMQRLLTNICDNMDVGHARNATEEAVAHARRGQQNVKYHDTFVTTRQGGASARLSTETPTGAKKVTWQGGAGNTWAQARPYSRVDGRCLTHLPFNNYESFTPEMKAYYASVGVKCAEDYVKIRSRPCEVCPGDKPNMPHDEGKCPATFWCSEEGAQKIGAVRAAERQRTLMQQLGRAQNTFLALTEAANALSDEGQAAAARDACAYIVDCYHVSADDRASDIMEAIDADISFTSRRINAVSVEY